jgi:NhaA family Na+:H+ antiporter
MPTDIAFTLGILALASRRAPPGLRSFVLTLAIVDDILTFAVIAVFYPADVDIAPLVLALAAAAAMLVLVHIHVRALVVYIVLGVGMWAAMHASGVPAALTGVVIALLTPASPIRRRPETEEAVSPLARVEHLLLPWTSFLILPLFALANAGVRLSSDAFAEAATSRVSIGIVVGRVAGKIAGIGLAAWAATRLGFARLPAGVRFAHVLGVAAAAGIAFTVSLFVADLAFGGRPELVQQAKIGILACAPLAGLLGYLLLRSSAGDGSSESD